MPNLERVAYIGDRHETGREWMRRRYIFPFGKEVMVPQEFGEALLATPEFILSSQVGRPLEEIHEPGSTILCRRWGALGDLLMFRAAMSAFIRQHPFMPILRCQERFLELFKDDPLWKAVVPIGGSQGVQYDGVVSFDQVAEADHRGDHRHRAQLFLSAMSKHPIELTPADWRLPIPDVVGKWVERHLGNLGILEKQRNQPLIGVHVRGSGPMKSLPPNVAKNLIRMLLEIGDVMILEPEKKEAVRHLSISDRVFEMTHRDVLHGIRLMEHLDLAIVMDSGPLWMAHCAGCPILAILGPTRPEQRISMHPGYPKHARAICLNDLIDCPACFESATACKGSYRCMQDQPDWSAALAEIVDQAGSMLSGDIRLPVASNTA